MAAKKNEWVLIKHPKIDAPPARVKRGAFDAHYSDKGYVEVDEKGDAVKASTTTKKGGA